MTQKDTCDIYCYDEAKVKRIQGEMQKEDISSVAMVFKVLSDENRAKISYALCQDDELCVCDVANIIGSTVATASHHLRTLHKQGIVKLGGFMNLLTRIRKINGMLQNRRSTSVNYMEMAEMLNEVIETNVFIVSSTGKMIGNSIFHQIQSERMNEIMKTGQGSEAYIQKLFQIKETLSNIEFRK